VDFRRKGKKKGKERRVREKGKNEAK